MAQMTAAEYQAYLKTKKAKRKSKPLPGYRVDVAKTPRGIIVRLDQPTVLRNVMDRWHWRKRMKYKQDFFVLMSHAIKAPKTPWKKAMAIVTRRSMQIPDVDGISGGFKPLMDVFTARDKYGIGLVEDDSPDCLQAFYMPQLVKSKREQGTDIEIIRNPKWIGDENKQAHGVGQHSYQQQIVVSGDDHD